MLVNHFPQTKYPLKDIICVESNKRFGEGQKLGLTNNPVWTTEELPQVKHCQLLVSFILNQPFSLLTLPVSLPIFVFTKKPEGMSIYFQSSYFYC